MSDHGSLLDELDDARCWCDRTLEACEEAGGCRWSKQIASLKETGAMLIDRVRALDTELEGAQAAVQRVRDLAEQMRTWCSPYGVAFDYANRINEALDGTEDRS